MLWPRLTALALLASALQVDPAGAGAADPNPAKFLIVSAPGVGKVAYMRVKKGGSLLTVNTGLQDKMKTLIGSGLIHPQGLAVEQSRRWLLVADPASDAKKIYAYPLSSYEDTLSVATPKVLAKDVEARWVTVDGVGNIYFSDESRNQILKITRDMALRGDTTPQVVFDGTSFAQVSAPGGLAVDGFYTYWVNKQLGEQVGSVIRGPEVPQVSAPPDVVSLSKNSEKSYGLCLALNNVYYTQPEATIYGVKKAGSPVATVTDRLTNPRGCAWDGDGTVYVADKGANAVYSFASNMLELGAAEVSKTVDFEDAFGVAVFAGAPRQSPMAAWRVAFFAVVLLSLWAAGAAA